MKWHLWAHWASSSIQKTYKNPSQIHYQHEDRRLIQCPIPRGGALAIGSLLGREYHFSLDMWLLLGQPRPSGWSHTQQYMSSTVELSGLKCKKGTRSQVGRERVHLKQVGAEVNVIKRCCIKFSRGY